MADLDPRTPRRILISGSTGLIGRALIAHLRAQGDTVVPLVRSGDDPTAIRWTPGTGTLAPASVSGFDAVVHLAGEPVVGRWTAAKKQRIQQSRVEGTHELASALARAPQPPHVFVCASGINFYGDSGDSGDRGDRVLDESSPQGAGFLAEVSAAWEAACQPLTGISRIVNLRIGVVLAREGGTLGAMLPLFRAGLGGPFGSGRAYMSWITLHDLVRAIDFAIHTDALTGPINIVAPNPVPGRTFTTELATTLHRPAFLAVPAWAARLVFGQFADEALLASVRAVPRRLTEAGFTFNDPLLPAALRRILS